MSNFVHIYVFCRLTLGYYEASDLANISQHTVHPLHLVQGRVDRSASPCWTMFKNTHLHSTKSTVNQL